VKHIKIKLCALSLLILFLFTLSLAKAVDAKETVTEKEYEPAQYTTMPAVGTIEAIVTSIDPWGGVSNAVGCLQNATHYNYQFTSVLDEIIQNQLENEDGAVGSVYLEMNGRSVYPNGVVGSPTAFLYVNVKSVVEIDTEAVTGDLTVTKAYDLADEVVQVYENKLGLNFQRMGTYGLYYHYYPDFYFEAYSIMYVATPTVSVGTTAMAHLRNELSQLGGFMNILKGSLWPDAISHAVELYLPIQWTSYGYPMPSMPYYFLQSSPYYARIAHPDMVSYQLSFQSGISGGVAFNVPEYVSSTQTEETYSLAAQVGYSASVENKMYDDDSMKSMSAIAAAAPSYVNMNGIPSEWEIIDEDMYIPPNQIYYGTYFQGGPLEDYIKYMGTSLPSIYLQPYFSALMISPETYDYTIDYFWGDYPITPVDIREEIINGDYSTYSQYYPLEDINYDLLAKILEDAGLTPTVLTEYIDNNIAEEDPVLAVIKAFLNYFDNYHILDILDDSVYPIPNNFVEKINPSIEGFRSVFEDLSGIQVIADLSHKESIAEFVEEHWDITLQALWTAMETYSDDTTPIKNAVHDILDSENLINHFAPFMEMDLGSPIADSMGMMLAYNYEIYTWPTYTYMFHDISSSNLNIEFELNIDTSLLNEPYLLLTKTPNVRSITSGDSVTFSILVENLGPKTAYDIKVLDGTNPAFDGNREYYWTRDSLAPGDSWTISYSVIASDDGVYMDIPAICVYFNKSTDTYVYTTPMSSDDVIIPYETTSTTIWWYNSTTSIWTYTTPTYPSTTTWTDTFTHTYTTYWWYTTTVTTTYTTWWSPPGPYHPPKVPNYWSGSAFFTFSQAGNVITVGAGYTIWEGTVPMLFVGAGVGVAVVLLVGFKIVSSNVHGVTRLQRTIYS
jgi:hypothetical protein